MLAHLEALYWIIRLGGFHAAARHMNLTQPTLSARIRELEAALGEKLFYRGGPHNTLTPAGERASSYAEKILKLSTSLRDRDDTLGGLHGVLQIGAVEAMAFAFLPQLMAKVRSAHPEVELSVTVDVATKLASMLLRQSLDLAILSDPQPSPMLETLWLGSAKTNWVCRPELVLGVKRLTPQALRNVPVLSHPRASRLYDVTMSWFRTENVSPQVLVCNSLMLMSHFVEQGFGAALLPTNFVSEGLRSGRLVVLEADPPIPASPMYLCFNRNRDGATLRSVMGILEQEARASGVLSDDLA